MYTLKATMMKFVASVLFVCSLSANAFAVPTTVLDYSGSGQPGITLELTGSGVFQTTGAAAVASVLNWADFIPASDALGKIKITDVLLSGSAVEVVSGIYQQATAGGRLEAFDTSDNLLLSIDFSSGYILLTSLGTGGQFSSGVASFGGPLAAGLLTDSATHSISFVNWTPVGLVSEGQTYRLATSAGYGNGVVGGEQVPEPMTLLLFGSGVLGVLGARRKNS